MENISINTILEGVSRLSVEEQHQIRDRLNQLLDSQQDAEFQLQMALHEDGLLDEIKPSRTATSSRSFQPVEVTGKPVSETIIEERR